MSEADIGDGSSPTMRNISGFNKEHFASKSMSTEWTDEKHCLYLKSMEASFVNNLYQYKVLRHGCWEKINFERNKPRSVKVDGPAVLLANPWIKHYRSSRGRQVLASSNHHEKVALAADVSSYDFVEVTDQNFIDGEATGEIASQTRKAKRIKMESSVSPSQINDQVVPLSKVAG